METSQLNYSENVKLHNASIWINLHFTFLNLTFFIFLNAAQKGFSPISNDATQCSISKTKVNYFLSKICNYGGTSSNITFTTTCICFLQKCWWWISISTHPCKPPNVVNKQLSTHANTLVATHVGLFLWYSLHWMILYVSAAHFTYPS